MKLNCLNCNHEFDGSITKDELGWHSVCPECGSSFDVDVPEGRIVMAFVDDEFEECFTDGWHDDNPIITYYAFDDVKEFIKAWEKMHDYENDGCPDSMWYWLLDNGRCFCSGACDPGDIEIIYEHFGLLPDVEIIRNGNKMTVNLKDLKKWDYITGMKITVQEYDSDEDDVVDTDGYIYRWYDFM